MCHHRVLVDDPKAVVGLVEVGIGLLPAGGGSQRLPRLIGIDAALRLMIDARRLAMVPEGALVINVARGPLVVTDDLVAELESGHLGGAGIDVVEPEPLPPEGDDSFAMHATLNVVFGVAAPRTDQSQLLSALLANCGENTNGRFRVG